MAKTYHKPALPELTAEMLVGNPEGAYADVTLGGGGHARLVLDKLGPEGRLFCVDQDPEAWDNLPQDERATLFRGNFADIQQLLQEAGAVRIDGVLADLGVSFHQFDAPERGFSFRFDAPLDMRMDFERGETAAAFIRRSSPEDVARALKTYGEVRGAVRIARAITAAAERKQLETTYQLNKVIEGFAPRGKEHAFFAQVYQAFRIAVNDEMKALEDFLTALPRVLKPGGRAVVISYHSLEDRMVKNFFRAGNFTGEPERDFFGAARSPFTPLTRKPEVPEETEIKENPRARSAKLRAALFNPHNNEA